MAQAAIVEGGAASAGRVLAALALCDRPRPCRAGEPSLCEQCARAVDGDHPDLLELDASDGKAQVERVRALRAAALTRPYLAERRVFVIRNAERLSESSQNALLKVMEEPPEYARFLLLTARAEALLATVRSRCALYRLPNAEEETPEAARETSEQADALIRALDGGAELDVCRVVMGWTRTPREDFARLMECLMERLVAAMAAGRGDWARLDKLTGAVREILEEQVRNVAVSAACAKILHVLD